MNTRKLFGGAVSAALILGLSGIAQADHGACVTEAEEIRFRATMLKCAGWGGTWSLSPIWQFQGKNGDGCQVHDNLAKQLFEEHDDPPKGRGEAKGRPAEEDHGHGAAAALLDHKFEDAIFHLQNFQATIESKAKLNMRTDADFGKKADGTPYTAADWAEHWRSWAKGMELRIFDPATNEGCSVP